VPVKFFYDCETLKDCVESCADQISPDTNEQISLLHKNVKTFDLAGSNFFAKEIPAIIANQ
jgi:hypothetical protein